MPKRSRKPKPQPGQKRQTKKRVPKPPTLDENQMAYALVRRLESLDAGPDGKDPLAVTLGRRGGLKGGRARADKLTKDERVASALKAARARWDKEER